MPNFKSSGQGFLRHAITRVTTLRVTLVRVALLGNALDLRVMRSVKCLAPTGIALLELATLQLALTGPTVWKETPATDEIRPLILKVPGMMIGY